MFIKTPLCAATLLLAATQIDKNKQLVEELSKYLPDRRAELTPGVVRVSHSHRHSHSRQQCIAGLGRRARLAEAAAGRALGTGHYAWCSMSAMHGPVAMGRCKLLTQAIRLDCFSAVLEQLQGCRPGHNPSVLHA